MPALHSCEGIQAVHAVRAGAHVDIIVDDARARFGVAGRREVPELPSRGSVKAVKLGASIFMQTFANVEPPAGCWFAPRNFLCRRQDHHTLASVVRAIVYQRAAGFPHQLSATWP